jgi:hypothetical protein
MVALPTLWALNAGKTELQVFAVKVALVLVHLLNHKTKIPIKTPHGLFNLFNIKQLRAK